MEAVETVADAPRPEPLRVSYGRDLETAIQEMEKIITESNFLTDLYPSRWIAIKYLENDAQILEKGEGGWTRRLPMGWRAVTRKRGGAH